MRPLKVFKFVVLCFVIMLGALGCSDDGEVDRCELADCPGGVCDTETGACVNPDSCDAADACLPGYQCAENTCTTDTPCESNEECARGICSYGTCVNAPECATDNECLDAFRCDDTTCAMDRCVDVTCDRGVCDRTTGECVNEVICSAETQESDCLEGYACYSQECETDARICEDIDCRRGVCEALSQSCVNADLCADDTDCLANFFCGEEGQCQPNLCDSQGIACLRGVCNIRTTTCENADSCQSDAACVDGFVCVGTSCVPIGQECGEEGCPGNQRCELSPINRVGTCVENPGGCTNTIDCQTGRTCNNSVCGLGDPCAPDAFEPNEQTPTVLDQVMSNHTIDASICSGDVDVFTFDTTTEPEFSGLLVVDLAYAQSDVGNGSLRLALKDPNGVQVDMQESASGRLRIEWDVSVLARGVYTIEVSDVDVSNAGVEYNLFVDLMEPTLAAACLQAAVLLPDTPRSGNTSSGASFEYGSNCTAPTDPGGEDIYSFDVDVRSLVTLTIQPDGNRNLVASLRSRCESLDSELACIDPPGEGTVKLEQVLQPGAYYVLVEGAVGSSGGPYSITLQANPTVCSSFDNACINSSASQTCKPDGTGFTTFTCENGCDDTTGSCIRTPGDVCLGASDASAGIQETFNWDDFQNDYDPGFSGCVPGGSAVTSGPDVAYFVSLQPGYVLDVNLTRDAGDDVSLYLLRDCNNASGSCFGGVNAGTFSDERILYENSSQATEEFYVIADAENDSGYGASTITIAAAPRVCTPGAAICVGADIELCNDTGTATSTQFCGAGCSNGLCNPVPNDTCDGAIDFTASTIATGRIEEYGSDYNPGFSGCTGRSAWGLDAIYKFTPPAGQVVTVTLDATFDASLWLTPEGSCQSQACIDGSDETGVIPETVQFLSDGSTYAVIVDSRSSSETGQFTLTWASQTPTCNPGSVLGCQGTSIEYCSQVGLPTTFSCSTTCTSGRCDVPQGDRCIDALPVGSGSYTGAFTGVNDVDFGTGNVGACYFPNGEDGVGADTIYAITLQSGEYLFASLDSGTSTTTMYVMGNCLDGNTCRANAPENGTSDLVYAAQGSETVYLVVDRTATYSSSTSYTLDIDIRIPNCVPGTPTFCDVAANSLTYCDAFGFLQTYNCNGTCSGDACTNPTGDSCPDPIVLVAPTTVTGGFTSTNRSNSVQPRVPFDGECIWDGFDEPDGYETIYAIDMVAGDLLYANLDTSFTSAQLYVLERCEDTASCRANTNQKGAVDLYFRADQTQRYFLVVDATTTSSSPFNLSVDITPGAACAPGTSSCLNANIAEICDNTGLNVRTTVVCTNGCAKGRCIPDNSIDSCLTAPNVGSGITILGSFADYTDDISLTSSDCVGSASPGPDVMYEVTLAPNQVLKAKIQSLGNESPMLYLVSDCNNAASTCKVGAAPNSSTDSAELLYAATQNETLYVVADSTSSSHDEPFALDIEVLTAECTAPNTYCDVDGVSLQYCSEYGLFETLRCQGSCTQTSCDTPQGDICVDAVPMQDGSTFTGSYGNLNPDIDPGLGSCVLYSSDRPDGADAVFSVFLNAGERLDAQLSTSTSSSSLYILESCSDPANTCLIANTDAKSLQFVAPVTQTYFLVVDTDSAFTSSDFTLSVNIDPGYVCTPGRSSCESGVQTICDDSGLNLVSVANCTNGCQNREFCAPALVLPDTCATAELISGSVRLTDAFSRFTDDYDPTSTGCTNNSAAGRDAVYQLNLTAGDVLQASLTPSNSFDAARVYIVTGCADVTTSCLDGGSASSGGTATAGYVATGSETVYVVVDSSSSFDSDPYVLDIQVRAAECAPMAERCLGDARQVCSAIGLWTSQETCYFGCANAVCNPTPNDYCFGAIDATAGGVFNFSPNLYTNFYSPDDGANPSCTGYKADGPEAVFALNLNQGDNVNLTFDGPADASLWVSTWCGASAAVADQCIIGADAGDPETLQFIAPATDTFYVFADYYSNTSSTTAGQLVVDIQPTGACTPNSYTCATPSTVSFCDGGGTVEVEDTCANGCAAGSCIDPSGEWCGQAIDVTGGGQYQLNMDALADNYSLPNGVCLGKTPGRDAVLRADLNAGDILLVDVTAPPSEDPALYLSENCGALNDGLGSGCSVTGTGSGSRESLRFDATTASTVWVVVDSKSTNTDDGTWNVDVYSGPPAANDTCSGAIDVSAQGTFTAKLGLLTNNYAPDQGTGTSCTGGAAAGPEAVFSLTANAGDFVQLDLSAPTDVVLWVSTDCTDVASAADNCILGSNEQTIESLSFYAPSTGTFFVFADTAGAAAAGDLQLDVTIQSAGTCVAGTSACADANTISYCDNGGTVLRQDTCTGGCAAGACAAPNGDWCGQAINATGGGVLIADMDTLNNDFNFVSTACAGNAPGNDAVFAFDLLANEVLDFIVTAPTGNDPMIYLASDCASLLDDLSTTNCVATSDTSTTNIESFSYTATQAETVYMVVDSASATTGSWIVDVLGGTTCTPNALSCVGNWIATCNAAGDRLTPASECTGGCANGACLGQACAAPIPLAHGESDFQTYTGSDTSDLGIGASGMCNFTDSQPGTDHFYSVDLLAGQTLTASFTTTSSGGILWATTDCTMGSACVDNSSVGSSGSVTYTATTNETIYLVMDRTFSGSTSSYEYTLSVSIQ